MWQANDTEEVINRKSSRDHEQNGQKKFWINLSYKWAD